MMIRQAVAGAVLVWMLLTAVLFVLGGLIPAWPSWLELPWSDFDDFVVTPRGEVVVYTAFFHRLLIYDLEGRFLASLPGPRARGTSRLAVDVDGRVYIWRGATVWVASDLAPERFGLEAFGAPGAWVGVWILTEEGVPRPITEEGPVPAPIDRAVVPGEVIFAERGHGVEGRRRFDIPTGGWVERVRDSLVIHDATTSVTTLATPWYLYWFKFPFPGALAWIIAFVYVITERRLRPWLEGRRENARTKEQHRLEI